MIRDLSQTLKAILTQPGLPTELAAAQIVFDPPVDNFEPSQTTIDLFLYDVRENMELRHNEPHLERQNGAVIVYPPPLRIACSYLITAWPASGEELALQEQRLLSQVLQTLAHYPKIPSPFLQGSLIDQEPDLPLMTAQINGPKEPAEFWTALGNRLRPSISVMVTFTMNVIEPKVAPQVITHELRMAQQESPTSQEITFHIGGRITNNANNPVEEAIVTLVEFGLSSTTGQDGSYHLGPLASGTYTLRVKTDATVREFGLTIPAVTGTNYDIQLT